MLTAMGVGARRSWARSATSTTPRLPAWNSFGKQLPYVVMAMIILPASGDAAVFLFRVPLKGSVLTLLVAALLYVTAQRASACWFRFMRSQIAAIFCTAIITLVPATQFSGLIDPIASLEGGAALIGNIFPTSYFLIISRGVFSKALGLRELGPYFVPLLIMIPALILPSVYFLKKQED